MTTDTQLTPSERDILEYAYRAACRSAFTVCISAMSPFYTSELEPLAARGLLFKKAGMLSPVYCISPAGCEAISQSFAALGTSLSRYRMQSLVLAMAAEFPEVLSIIDDEQLMRVQFAISVTLRNKSTSVLSNEE